MKEILSQPVLTERNGEGFVAYINRQAFVKSVNDDLQLYASKRNGIALWRAYRLCREKGEPIPETILCYLDEMGRDLEKANNATEVAKAVRMTGRGYGKSPRKHIAALDRAYAIASGCITS